MTVELCLSTCREKGFRFSGLQWQIECYCGDEPEQGFKWTWTDQCYQICGGNSYQKCGGTNAMSLYSTPINLNGLCIHDDPSNRILSDFSVTGQTNLTIQHCKTICKGELTTMIK